MRKRNGSRRILFVIILAGLISIALAGTCAFMLAGVANSLQSAEEGAGIIGLIHSNEAADSFKDSIDAYRAKSEVFVQELLGNSFSEVDDFSLAISRLNRQDNFSEIMFIRYFKGGVEYSLSNQPFDMTLESKAVIVGSRMDVSFCAGVVEDRQYSISALAYCIPLVNCAYGDCIALFYPVDNVLGAVQLAEKQEVSSQLTTICSTEGEIVSILENNDFDLQRHNNIFEFLRKQINDKSIIDKAQTLVNEGRSGFYKVSISGQDFVLAISGIREHGTSPFAVIALYKISDIYGAIYSIVIALFCVVGIFFLVLLGIAVYFIVSYRASERRLKKINEYHSALNCPTRVRFERIVGETLNQNRGTKFAVVVVDVRNFDYMTEHMGAEQMLEELKRMRDFYKRFTQISETFGYAGNGRFLLLLHYRDDSSLGLRIREMTANLGRSRVTDAGERITLSVYGGIYTTASQFDVTPERMVDKAILAENATKYPFDFESFRVYNETLHSSNEMNEYIEVNMESALENHLFKVFYQPKYNIARNGPDGSEALVRWYNPETDEYMQPALFLPLFEENRFIVKVDHYVYEEVCKYISRTVAEHKSLYPISVNVSRITVTEPGFVEYYAAIKKKYNIRDNFITIEFTESFAFEDYERLRETVLALHKNGFMCSIDDFGSGFSSYNILKELPMDEIKLDRFFIDKGFSEERDFKVLSSVIQLGRGLNMKVTQEGVETKAQMDMIHKLGCDVIQGYYYSKPLVESDYDDFLTRKFLA